MIWTWVAFGIVVLVLRWKVWGPIMEALGNRESRIRGDLERAERSQKEAEALRVKYEQQLSDAQRSIQEMVNQARADGEAARAQLVSAARSEADKIVEKGRKDLSGETERLKTELRAQLAGMSVLVAEKVLSRAVDKKVQDEIVQESLKDLNGVHK
jgi:F-type H+-transporting ATPase subunit b